MSDSEESGGEDAVGLIAPIQSQDVRRIVAGQVISDLASTVKELVDNSLDSGATSINIRLFNQGVDVIEVSDDGCGVPIESRPLLAMKHATSKIRSFDELYLDTYDNGQMQLKSLGFRGEALFSLANLSQNLIVSTRTESDSIGQKMEFRKDGYLDPKSRADIPRKLGTTVAIVKLFDSLPVRRADFIKRIKAQRAKMLRLLQSYGVLCVGVRFNVIDITGTVGSPKCKTEVKLSTSQNSTSIKDTTSQVFGSKFLAGLSPIRVELASAIISSTELKEVEKAGVNKDMWRIEGLVSKAPGTEISGKAARDIQVFSLNGRPVALPKVSKIIAEAWRQFETVSGDSKKRPACILGMYLPNCMFDVNVSPDKREVLISEEAAVYAAIKNGLVELWSGQSEGKFVQNEAQNTSTRTGRKRPSEAMECEIQVRQHQPAAADSSPTQEETPPDQESGQKRRMERRNAVTRTSIGGGDVQTFVDQFSRIEQLRRGESLDADATIDNEGILSVCGTPPKKEKTPGSALSPKRGSLSISEQRNWNQTRLQFSPSRSESQRDDIDTLNALQTKDDANESPKSDVLENNPGCSTLANESPLTHHPQQMAASLHEETGQRNPASEVTPEELPRTSRSISRNETAYEEPSSDRKRVRRTSSAKSSNPDQNLNIHLEYYNDESDQALVSSDDNAHVREPISETKDRRKKLKRGNSDLNPNTRLQYSNDESDSSNAHEPDSSNDDKSVAGEAKTPETANVTWPNFTNSSILEQAHVAREASIARKSRLASVKETRDGTCTGSSKEGEYKEGDGTLSLAKDDFVTMHIIGQFNLGFILALGPDGQLWILDQHACDEKYNFEKLCKETRIHEQTLIAPLPLELSASEENCVLEHMDVFEKNGFRFKHDSTKPPRHRFSLTAVPHSGSGGDGQKAVQFGPRDVGALCSLLGADGACSSSGYIAGSGSGADGAGKSGNNAVRRHAGIGNETILLPKAVAMFASRACRSSIMIGDSLTQGKMNSLLQKLQHLDHPWTCAHGRPTIRHVKDLLEQLYKDEHEKL